MKTSFAACLLWLGLAALLPAKEASWTGNDERAEVDALVLHGEGERFHNDLPKLRPKHRFLQS